MSASREHREKRQHTRVQRWHGAENPKAFFAFLRADPGYSHRVISKWLRQRGFETRWVRRRVHFGVWNLHLIRGTVVPGTEDHAVRQTVRETLKRFGVDCPLNEVEVSVIGSRIGAAFIFHGGTPGSLVVSKGRENWCADEWP